MGMSRKDQLYELMIAWICEHVNDDEQLYHVLHDQFGMSLDEVQDHGIDWLDEYFEKTEDAADPLEYKCPVCKYRFLHYRDAYESPTSCPLCGSDLTTDQHQLFKSITHEEFTGLKKNDLIFVRIFDLYTPVFVERVFWNADADDWEVEFLGGGFAAEDSCYLTK